MIDFRDTPAEAAFRAEVRAFVRREAPATVDVDEAAFVGNTEWKRKLASRGWITPAWPKQYGGAGLGVMEQFIFNMELAELRAPPVGGVATVFAGPTLIVHGNDEQRAKYLPEIVTGEVVWCQGYSEPNAGSDLAGLQTRAVRDGDDYVVNGQKIWTTGAQHARWMILLARTDPDAPKHRGITYFIVDMRSPGVTVRPLINAAGSHEFNEVSFNDVRVPRENVIGEENRGWYLAQTTLSFERSGIGAAVGARQLVEDIAKVAREGPAGRRVGPHKDAIRIEIAERLVEAEVATMMSFNIISIQAKVGLVPGHEASAAKLFSSELGQRIRRTGMQLIGLYGQLRPSNGIAVPFEGRMRYLYLRSAAATIEGGTSEIQRNIIATRGLGLPRA